MPCASLPIGIVAVGCSAGSLWSRWSWLLDASTTHSVPLPAAIWSGFLPTSTGSPTTCVEVGVDLAAACRPSRARRRRACRRRRCRRGRRRPSIVFTTLAGPWAVRRPLGRRGRPSTCGCSPPAARRRRTRRRRRARRRRARRRAGSGSATSSAMRRPRGQPAGPAAAGRRAGGGAGGRRAGLGGGAGRRGRRRRARRRACRARAAPAAAASPVATLPDRRRGDVALQRGPGGAREVAGRRVALGGVLRHRGADHDVERRRPRRARARLAAGAGSLRCAYIFASSESRGNGTRPVSAWKSTAPSAYTSARASACSPRICSGAAKSGVPTNWPVRVKPPLGGRVLGQPEVGQVGVLLALVRDQHVRRLDVAVDEPAAVRGVERGRDLPDDPHRALGVRARPRRSTSARRSVPST